MSWIPLPTHRGTVERFTCGGRMGAFSVVKARGRPKAQELRASAIASSTISSISWHTCGPLARGHRELGARAEPGVGVHLDHVHRPSGCSRMSRGRSRAARAPGTRPPPSAAARAPSPRQVGRQRRLGVAVRRGPLAPLHLGGGDPGRAVRQLREVQLDDRQRLGLVVAEHARRTSRGRRCTPRSAPASRSSRAASPCAPSARGSS
jgi:hypothetical protein